MELVKREKHEFLDCDIYGFKNSNIVIMHSIEDGLNHISMSYKDKLPSYEEMKEARYQICPDIDKMAQIFPNKEEFVNLHPYCLHLWELA